MNDHYVQQTNTIIQADTWMLNCLRAVQSLQLDDWFIGAGFVRNKIWDVLHGYCDRTSLNDVDVVYFNGACLDKAADIELEQKLLAVMPDVPWSVTNLARIHLKYEQAPFDNSAHAIAYWPELPTCVGVSLNADQQLIYTAPWGLEPIFSLQVKPNHHANLPPQVFANRVKRKQWQTIWPKLVIGV